MGAQQTEKSLSGVIVALVSTVLCGLAIAHLSYLIITQISSLNALANENNVEINLWEVFGPYLWLTISYFVPIMIATWVYALSSDREIRAAAWDSVFIPAFTTIVPVSLLALLLLPTGLNHTELVQDLTGQEIIQLLSVAVAGFWIAVGRLLRKACYPVEKPNPAG